MYIKQTFIVNETKLLLQQHYRIDPKPWGATEVLDDILLDFYDPTVTSLPSTK